MLDGSPEMMAKLLVKGATSERFSVRAPDAKLFHVRVREPGAELTVLRSPHGSMAKAAESATLKVVDGGGKTVKEDKCSTDDAHEFR